MIKNILKICLVSLSLLMIYSCEEEDTKKPYGMDDSIPAQVSNVKVKNIPGGAILTYDLPEDLNILSVKASYISSTGKEHSSTISVYSDTLTLKGFGDTNEYSVKVQTVSYANVYSAPIDVIIKPLTPPIDLIFKSLTHTIDFGGFVIDFENKEKAAIAIFVLKQDTTTGDMLYYNSLHTEIVKGPYSVRGLPNKEANFGIFIRDRYDNISDTILFTGTPWREDFLDKRKMSFIENILGDVSWNHHGGNTVQLIDEKSGQWNFGHTEIPTEFPHRLTIDLGVDVQLGRLKLWQRVANDVIYQHGSPKCFNIYGRLDAPTNSPDSDPLDGWEYMTQCTSIKPSGLPLGLYSSNDWEYASLGEEYMFPRDHMPMVRYLRFEFIESWSGMKCSVVSELSFWGIIKMND